MTAGSLVLLAVILGLVASTWSLLLERKARHRAERAEQQQATLRESAEKALKEADEQRAAAQAAEKVTAKHVRRLAEDNYAQRIDVATVALHRNDLFRARKELDSCDPQLRGWEWSFVNFSTRLLTTVPGADKPLFTPDGRHLIVCGDGPTDRKLMIMDASTGETVSAIPVGRSVRSPAISIDGTRLACAYGNGVIALWDLVTQKQLWSNQIHTANCDGIVFSSDGTKLASAGHDGFLKLLRTADGLVLREWPLPGIRFRNVALSPDGKRITAGVLNTDANSSIQVGAIIWDTQTGAELFRLKGCTSIVETLAFSADGEWLVTGERDGTVQQWNANNGEFVRTITRHGERGHVERIQSVAISPDGRLLSSSAPDGIQVREFKTGRLIHTLPRSPDRTSIPWLTFSPDGSKLTAFNHTSGKPGDMAVFDISERGRTRVLTHGQKAWSVAFSPDGRRVVSGGMGQPARVWDVTTGEMLRALPVIDGRFVGFTPDGLRVLSGGSRGEAALWDVADGKSVRNFNGSQFYLQQRTQLRRNPDRDRRSG